MSALQLVCLVTIAIIGVTQAQCYGRVPLRRVPPVTVPVPAPCYSGPDDLSALLLLAKAIDRPCDDVNTGEIINKLTNALIYATTKGSGAGGTGGAGGPGGPGGPGGSGGSVIPLPTPEPKPSEDKKPALIDLGLLTGDDLLNLILAGQDVLSLNVGKGGGAITKLVDGLL